MAEWGREFDGADDHAATLETDGTITQASLTAAHQSSQGFRAIFDGGGLNLYGYDTNGTDVSEGWWRAYVRLDSNIGGLDTNSGYILGGVWDVTASYYVTLWVMTDGSGDFDYFYIYDSQGAVLATAASGSVTPGVHQCVEFHWRFAVDGAIEGWLDDVAFPTQYSGDLSGQVSVGSFYLTGSADGGQTNYPANTEWFDYDHVRVSDTARLGTWGAPTATIGGPLSGPLGGGLIGYRDLRKPGERIHRVRRLPDALLR